MGFKPKLLALALALAGGSAAHAQIYKGTLSGANEIPAITTNGSGIAVVSLNTTTRELHVKTTFSGLTGNTTSSHIHCCTVQPANAGVATTTPTFTGFPTGVTSGSFDAIFSTSATTTWNASFITANGGTPAGAEAAFLAGLNAGQSYFNIHSSFAAGGEIRGNLALFKFANGASAMNTGVAAALDALGANTGGVNDRLMAIASLNGSALQDAESALLPLPTLGVASVVANGTFAGFDQISNRLGGLRQDSKLQSGVWAKVADHDGEQEVASRKATVENDGWDVVVGIDSKFSDGSVLGGAFSAAEDDLEYTGGLAGSSGRLSSLRATVYWEKPIGAGFMEAMGTYARVDGDSTRSAGSAGAAVSNGNHSQYALRIGGGMTMELNPALTLTPQARLDWSTVHIESLRELGAGGLALNSSGENVNRTRIQLGGQMDWNASDGYKPFIRAFYNHELKDEGNLVSAVFAAGGPAFSVTDSGIDSSGYTLGVGINVVGSDAFNAALSYDYSTSDDYNGKLLQAKLLWRF